MRRVWMARGVIFRGRLVPRPCSGDTLGATTMLHMVPGLSSSVGNTVWQANRGTHHCRSVGALVMGTCLLGAIALGGCSRPESTVSPDESGPCGPCGSVSTEAGPRTGQAPCSPVNPAARASGVEVAQGATPDAGAVKSLAVGPDAAFAFLRVAREEPYVVFPAAGRQGQSEFALYKAAQVQLLKSRLVLAAALRKPGMSGLACLRSATARHDATGWLAARLRVDFPGDAEIMRVGLAIDEPREAAALVNAVVGAYLNETVEGERKQRVQRLDTLERLYVDKESELRSVRNNERQLAESMGVSQSPTGYVNQQLALEEVADARKELFQARSELRRVRAELRAAEILSSNSKIIEVLDYEVDALAQNDPTISQVLLPVVAKLKKQIVSATPSSAEKLTAKLKAVQAEIDTRRKELRRGQEEQKRAAFDVDIGARNRSSTF